MSLRYSPVTLVLAFAAGLGIALLFQMLGFAVFPADKTSTLLGVLTGLLVGGGILWAVRARKSDRT